MAGQRRAVAALVAAGLLCSAPKPARAEDRPLVLEFVLNGRSTGVVANFTEKDGVLYAPIDELTELGLKVPPSASDPKTEISLKSLPGVEAIVNEQSQTISVKATDAALRPQLVEGPADDRRQSSAAQPLTGLALNYALLGTESKGSLTGGGQLDGRFFSEYGTASTSGLGLFSPAPGQTPFIRLDSSWTYTESDSVQRWVAGDTITSGLSSTRPVRLGGIQLVSDFSTRPDLITFPIPVLSGSAQVPTTVDVLVNGVRQLTQPVTPGPFEIRSLPIVTGAGEVAIAYQDALGRQTITTVPFYASGSLLKPGLMTYSVETGFLRRNYSQVSNDYGIPVGVATMRRGITDWLTLEAHGEAASDLALLNLGGSVQVGSLGIVSVSGAASTSSAGTGWTSSLSAERVTSKYNIALSGTVANENYRDIAALNGSSLYRLGFRISGGVQLGKYGSIGAGYVRQLPFGSQSKSLSSGAADISLATATYQVQLADALNMYTTGYINQRALDTKTGKPGFGYGAMIGLSYFFGGQYSVNVSASDDSGQPSYVTQFNKPASGLGEYGANLTDSEGAAKRRLGQFTYESTAGEATLGVDQSPGLTAERLGFSGSVIVGGGDVFVAPMVHDSFAVVRTGDTGGLGVLYENRPSGQTGDGGTLLLTDLRANQSNKIALNPNDLPPDVSVDNTLIYVKPRDRSGVLVDFNVHRSNGALVHVVDAAGKDLPVGAVANDTGDADPPIVGFDGQIYLTNLKADNIIQLELPNGSHCTAHFPFKPVQGDLPTIGPVPCG